MALSAAFSHRIAQMEHTRNERLALLQAEKELQVSKSKLLALKVAQNSAMEQRCLMFDRRMAMQNFIILSLKGDMENLDAVYLSSLKQHRALKVEIEELEEMEKESQKFYYSKSLEMKKFRDDADTYEVETRKKVEQLKNQVIKLKSIFTNSQGSNAYENNAEIAEAESKRSELQPMKESLEKKLASNYRTRAQLQKQLEIMLMKRDNG